MLSEMIAGLIVATAGSNEGKSARVRAIEVRQQHSHHVEAPRHHRVSRTEVRKAPPKKKQVHHTYRVQHHSTTGIRAYALTLVGPGQFSCLEPLWNHESGWRATADNPDSSAYGIPQLMHDVLRGVPPRQQVQRGLKYIHKRYGSPCNAWAAWQRKGWY